MARISFFLNNTSQRVHFADTTNSGNRFSINPLSAISSATGLIIPAYFDPNPTETFIENHMRVSNDSNILWSFSMWSRDYPEQSIIKCLSDTYEDRSQMDGDAGGYKHDDRVAIILNDTSITALRVQAMR